ncbi:hypothetical protein QQF64_007345 [Cirrhinus molitorella]|uniref:Uncharacterized protein n=1 Tax=Cirrhinus molitorella TaxID=172907 RepID=A0ABR3MB42_9TELE
MGNLAHYSLQELPLGLLHGVCGCTEVEGKHKGLQTEPGASRRIEFGYCSNQGAEFLRFAQRASWEGPTLMGWYRRRESQALREGCGLRLQCKQSGVNGSATALTDSSSESLPSRQGLGLVETACKQRQGKYKEETGRVVLRTSTTRPGLESLLCGLQHATDSTMTRAMRQEHET